ncbi:MAG: 4Fe-4S binding protein [Candidatus Cloacimonetes bacterium]|nr:4Fe-4S binding protein [Candidatus Cloacimonadota bacterium]MBS3766627.1 4Fe-4S binding protein [Candidatus Cloacimonadota bacterium]
MKFKVIKEECDICGTCAAVCPVNAIILNQHTATIDQQICIGCKNCFVVCPVSAIEKLEVDDEN